MALLRIGEAVYEVRPFRLRELRLAAPFIDRAEQRRQAGGGGFELITESAYDMLCVLALGLDGVSADALEAELGVEDLPALREAFAAVLAEAGFKPVGEETPAAAPAAPSPTASGASSPRSARVTDMPTASASRTAGASPTTRTGRATAVRSPRR